MFATRDEEDENDEEDDEEDEDEEERREEFPGDDAPSVEDFPLPATFSTQRTEKASVDFATTHWVASELPWCRLT